MGAGDQVVGVTFECDFPPEARTRRIVSTSRAARGLTPAEIDAVVAGRMAAGEDLYRLDAGALADLDADLVVTQDLCAVCAVDVSVVDEALAHLGCRAEVLTLDPMILGDVLGLGGDPRQGDRHGGGATALAGALAARPAGHGARRGRRPRAGAGDGARVDRPAVHPWPLGAGHGRRGRRRPGARRRRSALGAYVVAGRPRPRDPRWWSRRRAASAWPTRCGSPRRWPTGCLATSRCGRSTPTRPSRARDPDSWTASRRWPP